MKYTGKGNYFGGSGGGMGAFKPPYADQCEAGSTYANRVTDIETNLAKKVTAELRREKASGGIVPKKSERSANKAEVMKSEYKFHRRTNFKMHYSPTSKKINEITAKSKPEEKIVMKEFRGNAYSLRPSKNRSDY